MKKTQTPFLIFFILSFLMSGSLAQAQDLNDFFPHCPSAKKRKLESLFTPEEKKNLPPIMDTFDLMMAFEEIKNVPTMRQSISEEVSPMGAYPISKVKVDLSDDFPEDLKNKFIRTIRGRKKVFFPVHPLNTATNVGGWDIIKNPDTPKEELSTLRLRALASRSKVGVEPGVSPFGIKMGTDHILSHIYQPGKVEMDAEALYSRARTRFMDKVDEKIGKDPSLTILREIGSFRLKEQEGAFIIRDLEPLKNGDIYVPGFSIPYVGRPIAEANGQDFATFWGEHYAHTLGRNKAKLLLRYGLQMLTPNSQNMLVQLDADLKPKGMVFRDNSDSHYVKQVVEAMDPKDPGYLFDKKNGNFIRDYIYAHNGNSTWRFDEAPGENAVSESIINDWNKKQADGYLEEINASLEVDIKPLASATAPEIEEYKKRITDSHHSYDPNKEEELRYIIPIAEYLESDEGQEKLRNYRRQLIQLEKEKKLAEMQVEESCLDPGELVAKAGPRTKRSREEAFPEEEEASVNQASRSTWEGRLRTRNQGPTASTQVSGW